MFNYLRVGISGSWRMPRLLPMLIFKCSDRIRLPSGIGEYPHGCTSLLTTDDICVFNILAKYWMYHYCSHCLCVIAKKATLFHCWPPCFCMIANKPTLSRSWSPCLCKIIDKIPFSHVRGSFVACFVKYVWVFFYCVASISIGYFLFLFAGRSALCILIMLLGQ